MRIATNNHHAGLGQPQLRANHVNDSLIFITHPGEANAKFIGIFLQGVNLLSGNGILNVEDVFSGHVVIHCRKRLIGTANLTMIFP